MQLEEESDNEEPDYYKKYQKERDNARKLVNKNKSNTDTFEKAIGLLND